jgi:phosphatidylinositol alpha-1,6-mannosyltransferase
MASPLRIGVLAPEYSPLLGGMAELARGLSEALAVQDTVRVFALPSPRRQGADHVDGLALTGKPWVDGPLLAAREGDVDLWLALNAGLMPLARWLRQPLFAYWHGNDFLNPWLPCGPRLVENVRRPYWASLRHALRRRAIHRELPAIRHFFTNSRQTAALMERAMDLPAARITVCPPGVDDSFFQERPASQEGAPLRLLTVARLSVHTRRKNVDGVLEALALLGAELDVRYVVVGDGDDRARLEAKARELGMAERVRFTGSVDAQGLRDAYGDADLMVLAAKATASDVEGFGMVYIEAAAAGVPSICSRQGGAIDAVLDGRTGILIDDSSPAAIAAGIRRFAGERDAFHPHVLRDFADSFRWPRIAAQLRAELVRHLGAPA